jgi:hypothetical protein
MTITLTIHLPRWLHRRRRTLAELLAPYGSRDV